MTRFVFLSLFILNSIFANSQDGSSVSVQFDIQSTVDSNTTISKLMFYISGFELLDENRISVYKELESYHLIDFTDTSSMRITLDDVPEQFSFIKFNLGIDSLTNVGGALGGELDPIHGMYWTWQSGYIGFKLEGTNPLCPTRKHKFNFHLGGYQSPYAAFASSILTVIKKETIIIDLDIAKVFSNIDLQKSHTMMSPSQSSADLTYTISTLFKAK